MGITCDGFAVMNVRPLPALIAAPIEYTNTEGETVVGDFRAPYHWAAFPLIGDWQ